MISVWRTHPCALLHHQSFQSLVLPVPFGCISFSYAPRTRRRHCDGYRSAEIARAKYQQPDQAQEENDMAVQSTLLNCWLVSLRRFESSWVFFIDITLFM